MSLALWSPGHRRSQTPCPQPAVPAWPWGGGGSATWSSVPCFELPQLSLWPRTCRLCGLRLMLRPYLASCVAVAPSWERENLLVTVPFRGAPAQPPVQTFPCTSGSSSVTSPFSLRAQATPTLCCQRRGRPLAMHSLGATVPALPHQGQQSASPFPRKTPSTLIF